MIDTPDICPNCGSDKIVGADYERFVDPDEGYDDEVALSWACEVCGEGWDPYENLRRIGKPDDTCSTCGTRLLLERCIPAMKKGLYCPYCDRYTWCEARPELCKYLENAK